MKQIIAITLALVAVGLFSATSASAFDLAIVTGGDLTVHPSSNELSFTDFFGNGISQMWGDHTIAGTEFFDGIVEDNENLGIEVDNLNEENDNLEARVSQLISSDPSDNSAPSQRGAKIFQDGHAYLNIHAPEGCVENIRYYESSGSITVEGMIGSGIFEPTYKGNSLEAIDVATNPVDGDCEWNRIIVDIPSELNNPVITEITEDMYYQYVTYRIPK